MKMSSEMQEKRYNGGLERKETKVKLASITLGLVRGRLIDAKKINDKNLIEDFTKRCADAEKDYLNKIKEKEDYINKYREFITVQS